MNLPTDIILFVSDLQRQKSYLSTINNTIILAYKSYL